MDIEELEVYKKAMKIADIIWNCVVTWDYLAKDTVGRQLIRSVDSVAANLSEGFGRFFYKENKQFCYYSRGSLYETRTWLKKAQSRKLIKDKTYSEIGDEISIITKMLNAYIKSIGTSNDN